MPWPADYADNVASEANTGAANTTSKALASSPFQDFAGMASHGTNDTEQEESVLKNGSSFDILVSKMKPVGNVR